MNSRFAPRPLSRVVLLTLVTCLGGCSSGSGGGDGSDGASIDSIVVDSAGLTTLDAVGDTVQLDATARRADGSVANAAINWTSRSPDVLSVTDTGLVTALSEGTSEIVAFVGGVSAGLFVTVDQVALSMALDFSSVQLAAIGETRQLSAVARDRNGHAITAPVIEWRSLDPAVATVLAGTVTAVANGSTQVEAQTDGVIGLADVQVAQAAASVSIGAPIVIEDVGETATATATAFDATGHWIEDAVFEWASEEPSVATVDGATGLVSATGGGVTQLFARSDDAWTSVEAAVREPRTALYTSAGDARLARQFGPSGWSIRYWGSRTADGLGERVQSIELERYDDPSEPSRRIDLDESGRPVRMVVEEAGEVRIYYVGDLGEAVVTYTAPDGTSASIGTYLPSMALAQPATGSATLSSTKSVARAGVSAAAAGGQITVTRCGQPPVAISPLVSATYCGVASETPQHCLNRRQNMTLTGGAPGTWTYAAPDTSGLTADSGQLCDSLSVEIQRAGEAACTVMTIGGFGTLCATIAAANPAAGSICFGALAGDSANILEFCENGNYNLTQCEDATGRLLIDLFGEIVSLSPFVDLIDDVDAVLYEFNANTRPPETNAAYDTRVLPLGEVLSDDVTLDVSGDSAIDALYTFPTLPELSETYIASADVGCPTDTSALEFTQFQNDVLVASTTVDVPNQHPSTGSASFAAVPGVNRLSAKLYEADEIVDTRELSVDIPSCPYDSLITSNVIVDFAAEGLDASGISVNDAPGLLAHKGLTIASTGDQANLGIWNVIDQAVLTLASNEVVTISFDQAVVGQIHSIDMLVGVYPSCFASEIERTVTNYCDEVGGSETFATPANASDGSFQPAYVVHAIPDVAGPIAEVTLAGNGCHFIQQLDLVVSPADP